MKYYYLTFHSVTYAQRGEKALTAAGIRCALMRTPRWMEEQGCGYALVLPEGLTSLGSDILDGNAGVKELTIPASVTQMSTSSQGSLRGSGVEKLIFAEGRTAVPSYAAQTATKLTEVILPESLAAINGSAFEG